MKKEIKIMTPEQQKEIALWIGSKYEGGTGASFKYVLARCMGVDKSNLKESYPYNFCDFQRCAELYNNCSFVRETVSILFDEKRHGCYPLWKMLFTVGIEAYNNNNKDYIREILHPSALTLVPYLIDEKIPYTVKDDMLRYIHNKISYYYSKNNYGESPYYTQSEIEEEQGRYLQIVNHIKNVGYENLTFDDVKPLLLWKSNIQGRSCDDKAFSTPDDRRLFHSALNNHKDVKKWIELYEEQKTIN